MSVKTQHTTTCAVEATGFCTCGAETRSAATRRDFTTGGVTDDLQKPEVFLQWKGTDACFDFACECGAHHHFDGYFAYFVKCGSCGTVWEMPIHLYPRKGDPDGEPQVELADWQEDE